MYMGRLSEVPHITEDYVPVLRIEAIVLVGTYRTKQLSPDPLKWVSVKKLRQCPHGSRRFQRWQCWRYVWGKRSVSFPVGE